MGFGCLGIVGLVLVFAIGSAALLGGEEDGAPRGAEPVATASATGAGRDGDGTETAGRETRGPAVGSVGIVATPTACRSGTACTAVRITVTNNGGTDIGVDPLAFSLTDADGGRHPAEAAGDENLIATVVLAPGEDVTGTVAAQGTFTPAHVTFVDGITGVSVRAEVG
ncbi:DUF4352 domain-containing protein [Streptomyces sp. NPDC001822]|uniref:DUF4352 domain-containing protein n=1 Tax=Streptomyces sp. NPDC001822 TaxID=3364614 RepID=UPI0036904DC5